MGATDVCPFGPSPGHHGGVASYPAGLGEGGGGAEDPRFTFMRPRRDPEPNRWPGSGKGSTRPCRRSSGSQLQARLGAAVFNRAQRATVMGRAPSHRL